MSPNLWFTAAFTWLRSLIKKAPTPSAQVRGIPRGVRLATMAEADTSMAAMRQLPVVSILCQHNAKSPYPPELEEALWDEYKTAYEESKNDYSCGVVISVLRCGSSDYEPLDIMKKVSDHLVAFLKSKGIDP